MLKVLLNAGAKLLLEACSTQVCFRHEQVGRTQVIVRPCELSSCSLATLVSNTKYSQL